MNDNLKPCPFCNDKYIFVHLRQGRGYTIGCNTLGCICLHTEGNPFKTKEAAIESWNRRVMGGERGNEDEADNMS